MHELFTRKGPFNLGRDPSELSKGNLNLFILKFFYLDVVMAVADKYAEYRPSISSLECQDYVINVMKVCWSENPQLRPSRLIYFSNF